MKIYIENFQDYLAKEINMTNLFTDNSNLFADDAEQSVQHSTQEESKSVTESKPLTLTERFKQSKAETNSRLGVIESPVSTLTTEEILNGGKRKRSFNVADDGSITTEKGIGNSTLNEKAELIRAIRSQVYNKYGVSE
jgi:hypothetical protein